MNFLENPRLEDSLVESEESWLAFHKCTLWKLAHPSEWRLQDVQGLSGGSGFLLVVE